MTNKYSEAGDNNGLCELCSSIVTLFEKQQTYPVLLGGGIGWGTLWTCAGCRALLEERDRGLSPGKGVFTKAQLAQLDVLCARKEREPGKLTEIERQLSIARSNASVANQLVEKLATENAQLRRDAVTLTAGSGALVETLRQRVTALELELTLVRAGTEGTQKPGAA